MRQIANNAGVEGAIVVAKVREMKQDEGFNAATETYEDLVKAGVIDPAKVVRSALQNAASVASLLLTAEALISEIGWTHSLASVSRTPSNRFWTTRGGVSSPRSPPSAIPSAPSSTRWRRPVRAGRSRR